MHDKIDDILHIIDVGLQTAAGNATESDSDDECWRCLDRTELNDLGVCPACDTYLRADRSSEKRPTTAGTEPAEAWMAWLRNRTQPSPHDAVGPAREPGPGTNGAA